MLQLPHICVYVGISVITDVIVWVYFLIIIIISSYIIIHCRLVSLNGIKLTLVDNLNLPAMPPMEEPPKPSLNLPPMSFGFLVFKNANAEACIH